MSQSLGVSLFGVALLLPLSLRFNIYLVESPMLSLSLAFHPLSLSRTISAFLYLRPHFPSSSILSIFPTTPYPTYANEP